MSLNLLQRLLPGRAPQLSSLFAGAGHYSPGSASSVFRDSSPSLPSPCRYLLPVVGLLAAALVAPCLPLNALETGAASAALPKLMLVSPNWDPSLVKGSSCWTASQSLGSSGLTKVATTSSKYPVSSCPAGLPMPKGILPGSRLWFYPRDPGSISQSLFRWRILSTWLGIVTHGSRVLV